MSLNDLLNPERAVAAAGKLFFKIFAIIALCSLLPAIANDLSIPLPDAFTGLIGFMLISLASYAIRERRERSRRQPRGGRASERTPNIPG